MKLLFTIFTLFCFQLFASKEIPGIKLKQAKVKSATKDTTSIGGLKLTCNKFIVTGKVRLTIRSTPMPHFPSKNKYKDSKATVAIYQIKDTNCVIRDSIYASINAYWKHEEAWLRATPGHKDSTHKDIIGDFTNLPINQGFYNCFGDTVPFIQPMHNRIGTYKIFYFNGNFYKVVLIKTKHRGRGGMRFISNNMVFTKNNKEYPVQGYTSSKLIEIKKIIEKKINCG